MADRRVQGLHACRYFQAWQWGRQVVARWRGGPGGTCLPPGPPLCRHRRRLGRAGTPWWHWTALAMALCVPMAPAFAQSWNGNVGGTTLEISGRDSAVQGRSFVVYLGGNLSNPLALHCGYANSGQASPALFCSDDLNRYIGPRKAISTANHFNLRFSLHDLDYACAAALFSSPMFCRMKVRDAADFGGPEFRLQNIRQAALAR
ncbi:hypothetical protein [Massilia sp. DWR3-1-1]|uniref:hypothetical protein n=1 Tax=Massilia sp. DWR3-1-1 TaxID=2804559 RepID=UPI003CF53454